VTGFRSFLFGKWFFAVLFFASLFDLATDLVERARLSFWSPMNGISIGLSAVVAALAAWMFLDLYLRKPK